MDKNEGEKAIYHSLIDETIDEWYAAQTVIKSDNA